MEKIFKAGEIVQLKSGGPDMTVKEHLTGDAVICQWFGGKKLEDGVFHPDSLNTVTRPEK